MKWKVYLIDDKASNEYYEEIKDVLVFSSEEEAIEFALNEYEKMRENPYHHYYADDLMMEEVMEILEDEREIYGFCYVCRCGKNRL